MTFSAKLIFFSILVSLGIFLPLFRWLCPSPRWQLLRPRLPQPSSRRPSPPLLPSRYYINIFLIPKHIVIIVFSLSSFRVNKYEDLNEKSFIGESCPA